MYRLMMLWGVLFIRVLKDCIWMFLLFSFVLVVWEVSVKGREECFRVRREWCGGF